MRVEVVRDPGDRQGPDISDSLLTDAAAARERGRNEIDAACSNRVVVSGSGPLRSWMQPGSLVEVADSEQLAWRGQLTRVAINLTRTVDSFTADTAVEIEREA